MNGNCVRPDEINRAMVKKPTQLLNYFLIYTKISGTGPLNIRDFLMGFMKTVRDIVGNTYRNIGGSKMSRFQLTTFVVLISLILLTSCSGGGSSPVTPEVTGQVETGTGSPASTHLWGLYDVAINFQTGSVEIIPARGVEFTVNINKFMQPPVQPQLLITIAIDPLSDPVNGYIIVDITTTHPFPGNDTFTAFDFRGVLMGYGSVAANHDSEVIYAGEDELRLLNADGYTRWYNASEFTSYDTLFGFSPSQLGFPFYDWTATINGYKYFCDYLEKDEEPAHFFSDDSCPNPRGYTTAGTANSRQYEIQFPMSAPIPFAFQFALLASWDLPTVIPPVHFNDEFPLTANCDEAYMIEAQDVSDMYFGSETTYGGDLALELTVFDRQGAVNPSGVSGEIARIHLETPDGLIDGGFVSLDSEYLDSVILDENEESVTYLLEVSDVTPYQVGLSPVLIVVENEDPSGYNEDFPGFDSPDAPLAAYFWTEVDVDEYIPQNDGPVAVASVVTTEPICPGDDVEFDGSMSYDQDGGSIISWEWDFDEDGIYGDPYDSGDDEHPVVNFAASGKFYVDLKVTSDSMLTDTLDDLLVVSVGGPTWVDDDADPLSADGSFENPWPTIQEGIDNAFTGCGDKWVLVKDGIYEENIVISHNTILEGYSDPPPLITTEEASPDDMVDMTGAGNSTIKHFNVQPKCLYDPDAGIQASGIRASGVTNCTVMDIEFIDNPGGETCTYAVIGGGWSGGPFIVDNVRFDGYHKTVNGLISVHGVGAQVTNCVLLNITFHSRGAMTPLYVRDTGPTGLIAKNVIGHITYSDVFDTTDWVRGLSIDHCQGATVRNNLVFDIHNTNTGGWTWGIDISDAENMTLEHNTVAYLKGPQWIYAFEATDFNIDPSGVTHRDHIVTNLTTTGTMQGWRWAYLGMWSDFLPVDYSCAYSTGNGFYDGVHEVIEGVGFTYQNPMFVDPMGDDFQLQPGSPCIGTAHDGSDMGAYGGPDPLTWVP